MAVIYEMKNFGHFFRHFFFFFGSLVFYLQNQFIALILNQIIRQNRLYQLRKVAVFFHSKERKLDFFRRCFTVCLIMNSNSNNFHNSQKIVQNIKWI